MAVSTLNMAVSLVMSFTIPASLDEVSYRHDVQPWVGENYDHPADIMVADPSEVLDSMHRETIAMQSWVQVGICAMASVVAETGTPLIMQVQYGWSSMAIGYGMGAVFAFACIFMCIVGMVRLKWGPWADKRLAFLCLILSTLGGICYFDLTPGTFVIIGDALVYPSITIVTGMLIGCALWSAHPEKWNHRENIVTVSLVVDSMMKCVTAPVMRWVLGTYGRAAYSAIQVVFISFTFWNFLWIRCFEMYIDSDHLEDAVPSSSGHFFMKGKGSK